eukprot:TRINITY_DN4032_c0_g1_i9.p1 TRINITY_DN4032_c0_g1~~TRINITY_DN4032_c0_g1_i9.p1  ORF type:complete len:182 (-),score=44.17 TRINITY_DN4032_c0_g1_i9:385-930(-)
MAAIGGHTTVLKYLLHQKGADPDAPEQAKMKNTGSSGINAEYGPLHSLINSKRVDLFEKKIEDLGGQVSDVDEKNISPLLHAAILGAAPFVKLLVEHQASLLEKTPEGRNAIHMAAIGGHTTVLKYLLHQIVRKNMKFLLCFIRKREMCPPLCLMRTGSCPPSFTLECTLSMPLVIIWNKR